MQTYTEYRAFVGRVIRREHQGQWQQHRCKGQQGPCQGQQGPSEGQQDQLCHVLGVLLVPGHQLPPHLPHLLPRPRLQHRQWSREVAADNKQVSVQVGFRPNQCLDVREQNSARRVWINTGKYK